MLEMLLLKKNEVHQWVHKESRNHSRR